MKRLALVMLGLALTHGDASAADKVVEMHAIGGGVDGQGIGPVIGRVRIAKYKRGVLFEPVIRGLSPGLHGFHIHSGASCGKTPASGGAPDGAPGSAAGGHWHLGAQAVHHGGPYDDNGHLGDLPALYVGPDGKATLPVFAPRLKWSDMTESRALAIKAGGDTYSDTPTNGGGGAIVACGVIPPG